MSRNLSPLARQAINAQETGEVFLLLLRITHESLAGPIRVVRDNQDLTSRGQLYVGFGFDIELPDEMEQGQPQVTLRMANFPTIAVEGEGEVNLIELIRSIKGRPKVELEVVLASQPDTVEAGPYDLTMYTINYDAAAIQATLAFEDTLNAAWPGGRFTPDKFPGLF